MPHTWTPLPDVEVSTCEKCGLLRVKTLNGEFIFTVVFTEPFLQCREPYYQEPKNDG